MMRASLSLMALTMLFTSCQVYQSCFDCAPGLGMPCTSLTEIENLIVETDQGPDIFLGNPKTCTNWAQEVSCYMPVGSRRVWIEGHVTDSGHVCGHYIYLFDTLEMD